MDKTVQDAIPDTSLASTQHEIVSSSLFTACGSGDAASLNEIQDRDLLLLTTDPASFVGKEISERTIYAACSKGHTDIVKCLLEVGVDPNVNSDSGTPIYAAAKSGHLDVVKLLVEYGADYRNVREKASPLFVACTQGKLNVIKYLISRGANPHAFDNPPLVFTACAAGYLDVVKYFIEELQYDINRTSSGVHALKTDGKDSLLHVACQARRKDIVSFLFQKGAAITSFILAQCSEIISEVVVERCIVSVEGGYHHANLKEMNLFEAPKVFFADNSATLTKIDLQSNHLVAIPCELFQMPALEDLNVSTNQLSTLCGDEIPWFCAALTNLDASHNQLKHIPYELFHHPHLVNLSLSYNMLEWLPGDPDYNSEDEHVHGNWTCEKLRKLDLSNNKLKALPDAMGKLQDLYSLDVSSNDLQCLPMSCTWGCARLRHLNASKNQLTDLPFGSSSCWTQSLETLLLDQNKITKISQNIAGLSRLTVLNLSHNMITSLPPTHHWKGTSLKILDLSNNHLTELTNNTPPIADSTGEKKKKRLKKQGSQDITPILDNELDPREFPITLWASSLRCLLINDNMIGSIPEYLSSLDVLSKLDISGNKGITFLPPKLGILKHCTELIMNGVPISNVPQNLLPGVTWGGSTKSVLAYLRSQLRNCVPNNRMKLMVVGLQGQGKTTLLSVLRQPKAPLPKNISTVGVNTADWVVKAPPGVVKSFKDVDPREVMDIVFSTWDMAGQEVYYATHQCFLSRNTLYLVVWNTEEGEEGIKRLQPWLLNIQAQAPNSPVIIVGTHLDRLPKPTAAQMKEAYISKILATYNNAGFPRLSCVTFVSCVTKEGLKDLQERIYAAAISTKGRGTDEHVIGMQVPSSYVTLQMCLSKEVTRRQTTGIPPILNQQEFAMLVSSIPNCDILDPEELSLAAQFLHNTGVLLHYNDHLKGLSNLYFIDPVWLANVLAQIITVPQKQGYTRNGILKRDDIPLIFKDECLFPSNFIGEYLQLLERYEIALSLGNDQYLIPSMLPVERPFKLLIPAEEDKSLPPVTGSQGQYQPVEYIRRRYKMAYIPSGFWSRLISRLLINLKRTGLIVNQLIGNDVIFWRNGVLVHHDTGKFLVESIQSSNTDYNNGNEICCGVDITVWSQCEDFSAMGYITDQLDSLIEEWYPGLIGTDITGNDLLQQQVIWKVALQHTIKKVADPECATSRDRLLCADKTAATNEVFPLKLCCIQALSSDTIVAEKLNVRVPLDHLIPDILMTELSGGLKVVHSQFDFDPQDPSKLLGVGSAGKVYKGKYRGDTVAIKLFFENLSMNAQQLTVLTTFRNLHQEVIALTKLSHPNIVALLGVSIRPLCIVLEFAPMGSLFGVLEKKVEQLKKHQAGSASTVLRMPGGVLGHAMTTKIAMQVALALKFIHKAGIIYRDLKAANVLVWSLDPEEKVNVKLADYSISRFSNPGGLRGVEGTAGYQAPEILQQLEREQAFDEKVDIFSFAMLLFELFTGQVPFEGFDNFKINIAIRQGKRPSLDDCNLEPAFPAMIELMINCWQQSPSDRPTANEIVKSISAPELLCRKHTITTCKDHLLNKVDAICVLPMNEHTPEDYSICTWAKKDEERQFNILDPRKGTFILSEEVVPGARVHTVMVTEEENRRMWIGCGLGGIQVYRLGTGGIPRHLWSFELNQTVLSLLAETKDGKITRIFAGLAKGMLYIFSHKSATTTYEKYRHNIDDAFPEICLTVINDSMYSSEADNWSNPLCLCLDVPTKSIKCMTFAGGDQLWCGCGNGIVVVDIINMKIIKQIPVFVKNAALVRELISDGTTVWGMGMHLSCVLQWDVKTYSLISVFDCSNVDSTGHRVNISPTELDDIIAESNEELQTLDCKVEMSKPEAMLEKQHELNVTSQPKSQKKKYSLRQTRATSLHQSSTQATSLAILDRTLWIGRGMGDIIIVDISKGPTHGKVLARLGTEDCAKYGLKSYHKLVAVGRKYVASSQWLEKHSFHRDESLESSCEEGRALNKIIIWEGWNHKDIENFSTLIAQS